MKKFIFLILILLILFLLYQINTNQEKFQTNEFDLKSLGYNNLNNFTPLKCNINTNTSKLNSEEAISAYLKAIEVKSDYFDANYNLGALYFNQAVQGINKANDMWKPRMTSKEAAAQKKLETEAKELFNTAKPYLEAAFSVNPEDAQTIRSLKDIYARTGEDEKFLQMNDLLKKSQQ